jgi:hypothetical protein
MVKIHSGVSLLLLALISSLPTAHARPKTKVSVATLAATYNCTDIYFSDSSSTEADDLVIVVSRSGAVTGTATIRTTDPACDPLNEEGIDCTTERAVSFKMNKLATPKKKLIYMQSPLKRKTIDSTTKLSISGDVKTFFSSVRYRSIDGVASLGTSANSLTATLSCSAPTTLR